MNPLPSALTSNPNPVTTLYDEDRVLADGIFKKIPMLNNKIFPISFYRNDVPPGTQHNPIFDTFLNVTKIKNFFGKKYCLKNFNTRGGLDWDLSWKARFGEGSVVVVNISNQQFQHPLRVLEFVKFVLGGVTYERYRNEAKNAPVPVYGAPTDISPRVVVEVPSTPSIVTGPPPPPPSYEDVVVLDPVEVEVEVEEMMDMDITIPAQPPVVTVTATPTQPPVVTATRPFSSRYKFYIPPVIYNDLDTEEETWEKCKKELAYREAQGLQPVKSQCWFFSDKRSPPSRLASPEHVRNYREGKIFASVEAENEAVREVCPPPPKNNEEYVGAVWIKANKKWGKMMANAGEALDYCLIEKLCKGVQWGFQFNEKKNGVGSQRMFTNVNKENNAILADVQVPIYWKAAIEDYMDNLEKKGIFFNDRK